MNEHGSDPEDLLRQARFSSADPVTLLRMVRAIDRARGDVESMTPPVRRPPTRTIPLWQAVAAAVAAALLGSIGTATWSMTAPAPGVDPGTPPGLIAGEPSIVEGRDGPSRPRPGRPRPIALPARHPGFDLSTATIVRDPDFARRHSTVPHDPIDRWVAQFD